MDLVNIPSLPKLKNGKRIFYNPDDIHNKQYRLIKNEISEKYYLKTSSRDIIIKQLIVTLTHGNLNKYSVPKLNLIVVRSDIKNFFPSINKHTLYQKLQKGNLLKSDTLEVLKPMFFSNRVAGVPLGLPFSSVLAEVYLENFDKDIWKVFQPTFYFRYVDDIVIIRYNTIEGIRVEEEENKLNELFIKHSLRINFDKTEINNFFPESQHQNTLNFKYLGYEFTIENHILKISITSEKLKKIENKIKKYFFFYKNSTTDNNVEFWKLYYRIKNVLYGVTSKDKNGKTMQYGFGFSYRFINDFEPILKILNLVRSLIFSCKFSSRKKHIMLSLIEEYEDSPGDLLKKRFNYTLLTNNQRIKMGSRLKIEKKVPQIDELFFKIYSNNNE